jgi:hypothetical protein
MNHLFIEISIIAASYIDHMSLLRRSGDFLLFSLFLPQLNSLKLFIYFVSMISVVTCCNGFQ